MLTHKTVGELYDRLDITDMEKPSLPRFNELYSQNHEDQIYFSTKVKNGMAVFTLKVLQFCF